MNQTFTKDKLNNTLNNTIIDFEVAKKLDHSLNTPTQTMTDDKPPTVHCPTFELFWTTISIGTKPCIKTNVIGIRCQSGQAALLQEFLIQLKDKLEQQGQGKFIPTSLANMIGMDTMQQIIHTNNQFLRNIVSIPINGLPPTALNAEIDLNENEPEENQTKTTIYDYITDAEWCLGLEPTNCEGWYLLLTTHQQVQEACNWLDKNLEALFTEYIPQYQTFTPIDGYDYPKWGDKPQFSHQLGNYADHLRAIYTPPSATTTTTNTKTKWNK